jgi:hypothetical protein
MAIKVEGVAVLLQPALRQSGKTTKQLQLAIDKALELEAVGCDSRRFFDDLENSFRYPDVDPTVKVVILTKTARFGELVQSMLCRMISDNHLPIISTCGRILFSRSAEIRIVPIVAANRLRGHRCWCVIDHDVVDEYALLYAAAVARQAKDAREGRLPGQHLQIELFGEYRHDCFYDP